jgi:hypothetical protein
MDKSIGRPMVAEGNELYPLPIATSVQIQSDDSVTFREAEVGRGAENGGRESSV